MTAISDRDQLSYIAAQAADARVNVEIETEGMTLNIGPQHPATHGTLRIVAKLDGEQVIAADPIMGYMHRGYEKLAEVRTYPQVTTLINRIDWVGSFANEVPFILAAEKLMDVEAPPRRVDSHDPVRDEPYRQHLAVPRRYGSAGRCGHAGLLRLPRPRARAQPDRGGHRWRFHPNFDRIGGLKDDLPAGWIAETNRALKKIRSYCDEIEGQLQGNEIFEARCRGIGVIPADVGLSYGLSGANIRASGVDWDTRRDSPCGLVHSELDWKVWTHPDGDSFARFWVRLQEVRESTKMVDQLCDGLPSGRSWPRSRASSRCPPAKPMSRPRTRWGHGVLRRLEG